MARRLLTLLYLCFSAAAFSRDGPAAWLYFPDGDKSLPVLLKSGEKRLFYFTIKNMGDTPLIVRSVYCSDHSCRLRICLPKEKLVLQRYETRTITGEITDKGYAGVFKIPLRIVSNAANSNSGGEGWDKNQYLLKGYVQTDTMTKGPLLYFPYGASHDFGRIMEGPEAEYVFQFINKGDQPLIIINSGSSSGALVPYYIKEPVLPGERGWVKLSYYTEGRAGPFNKTGHFTFNSATRNDVQQVTVYVSGTVMPRPRLFVPPAAPSLIKTD